MLLLLVADAWGDNEAVVADGGGCSIQVVPVTNELAARGLDVPECDLVVNLDLPTDSIHYAHRAGRTGRLGRKGTVLNVCEQSEVFVVKKLERQLGVFVQACDFVEGQLVIKHEERAKNSVA